MKITFLGTGASQGIPMLLSDEPVNHSTDSKDKRTRSSVLIQWNNFSVLVDCGGDFRYQMLANNVQHIDAILFTHEHSDHIAGLDDIRPFCYKIGPMPIYGMKRVIDVLSERYQYIFEIENRYPGAAAVNPFVVNEYPFELGGKKIIPIKVNHGNLPILGYRIDNFAYLTDVKTIPETEFAKLQNLEVLVISALRIEPHPTHLNLKEAIAMTEKISPEKAYFMHISHRLGFHEEVSKSLPNNIYLSYDGLSFDVG
ncbi:MBL fold metallo-hydrolase [Ochrovirga pacifica]|uniref:MBL fold metallo-hydrolase n=1 Tax=Ochrovirga pacifica TaxID=1042376 RepID=UPI00025591DB|nr:MBL fold metallo-hydrolase [Ochrovirga pacifica]